VTPVLVAPGQSEVIALRPEFITPQDGHTKQDCEIAAAKRWLDQNAARYHSGIQPVGHRSKGARTNVDCREPGIATAGNLWRKPLPE
jgi:hypothetical protein